MRYVISFIVILCLAYLAILGFGLLLPSDYETTKTESFNIPVDEVWKQVTQVNKYPQYRDDYFAIREISRRKGYIFEWEAFMSDGSLAVYQTNRVDPFKFFSYSLIKSNKEQTGTWDFAFSGDLTSCTIEISESSTQENPIEKVYAYFKGRDNTINTEFEAIRRLEK